MSSLASVRNENHPTKAINTVKLRWTMIGNELTFKWNVCQFAYRTDVYTCLTFHLMFICFWHAYNEIEPSIKRIAIYNKHAK